MPWNWELPHWPNFIYESDSLLHKEKQFLLGVGEAFAFLRTIEDQESSQFVVEILSQEGLESSKIEGEILDRESLQSSIKQQFGLKPNEKKENNKETGMAKLLCSVYKTFDAPLTQQMLYMWHANLFENQTHIEDLGKYRTHSEPMQIVSNRYGSPVVFFEAPPSAKVPEEMKRFVDWFNRTDKSETILGRAAIAHLYFENIHPFEDGNGRIGRILVEKVLSQSVGQPILIAVSKILEQRKKDYYFQLEKCNRTLDAQQWVEYFADVILEGQQQSIALLYFLIAKAKMLTRLNGQLNLRQEKAVLRMFAAGPSGFIGGLSAENYISITKATRATATRDLADLVDKGVLQKKGELRHTRYWLNLDEYFQNKQVQ